MSQKIKFYWNTGTPFCLCHLYGCFHTKIAELISYDRDSRVHKTYNVYYLAFYRKCLPSPAIYNSSLINLENQNEMKKNSGKI